MLNIAERSRPELLLQGYQGLGNAFENMGEQYKQYQQLKGQANASKSLIQTYGSSFGLNDEQIKDLSTRRPHENDFGWKARMESAITGGIMQSEFAKRALEMEKLKAETARLNAPPAPKPVPGSMGVRQETQPDGSIITRDNATGEIIPASSMGKPEKDPFAGRTGYPTYNDAIAAFNDPNTTVVIEEHGGKFYPRTITRNQAQEAPPKLPDDWQGKAMPLLGADGKPVEGLYTVMINGKPHIVNKSAGGGGVIINLPPGFNAAQ